MTRKQRGRKFYRMTEHGMAAAIKAFGELGYTERQVRGLDPWPAMPPPFDETETGRESVSAPLQERWQCIASFRLGDLFIRRGAWLTDEETAALERSRNRDAIVGSYLRKAVPGNYTDGINSARTGPPPIVATFQATLPPQWVVDLAAKAAPNSWAVQFAVACLQTHQPYAVAIDKVDSALLTHALKEWADVRAKPVSGSGTYRASVEHFNEYVGCIISRLRDQQVAAA